MLLRFVLFYELEIIFLFSVHQVEKHMSASQKEKWEQSR